MHKTEGANNVANMFNNGPPGTIVEQDWLNAVQEEIANVITSAGIALETAATDITKNQLYTALISNAFWNLMGLTVSKVLLNSVTDWLDQAVKQASSPTFAALTVTGAITSEGNAVARIKTGSYTGDGTVNQGITGVGFTPKFVKVWAFNGDGVVTEINESTTEMMARDPQGLVAHHSSAAMAHFQFDNKIISLDADGFSVSDNGVNEHPNKNGQVYDYMCIG